MSADAPLWLVIFFLVITNLVTLWQVVVANRARKEAVETADRARRTTAETAEQARQTAEANARRTENGLRVRWAAEQALSSAPGKQRLGLAVLLQLESDRIWIQLIEPSPGRPTGRSWPQCARRWTPRRKQARLLSLS